VLLALGVRYLGARLFYGPLENWSIVLWLAGAVIALAGWRVFVWSAPSIVFLLFMMPLPHKLEAALRLPLQSLATQISTAALVTLGYPALAESHVIRIGDVQYGVQEACSGLRIFVGIAALAFAYIILINRHWMVKAILAAAVLPVTLLANSLRIVATCILLQRFGNSESIQTWSHDMAGFVMIPLAAAFFGIALWYLGVLLREEAVVSSAEAIRSTGHNLRRPR
jgi:exosortase